MKAFMDDDFLLSSQTAKTLYHQYAKDMPIFDYHCHLSPKEIAENRQFNNLAEIWLEGDHYKWRGLRTAGVEEYFITFCKKNDKINHLAKSKWRNSQRHCSFG